MNTEKKETVVEDSAFDDTQPTQVVVQKSEAKIDASSLKELVNSPQYQARFREVLGERAPQFAAALVQITNKSYQLRNCKPLSVIGAALTAAALDLPIDPNLGHAHLVPYKDECQLQIGYLGFVQLAYRTGVYRSINAIEIYEGTLLKWDRLSGDLIVDDSKKTSEDVIGYAAYFELINGGRHTVYWTKEQVEKHALRYSQSYKQGRRESPWFTSFDAMAKKTVLKNLLKNWGSLSVQMQKAVLGDQAVFKDVDSEPVYGDNEKEEVSAEPDKTRKAEV